MRKTLFLLLLPALLIPASCKKYDEGPYMSFWPKAERIANKWKVAKADLNGADSTNFYRTHILEFTDQGTAIYQIGNRKYFGKDFDLDYDSLGRFSYQILRLKDKEFWYRDKRSNFSFQLAPF
jgi:hypothetical protein